jgi:5-oxoprolinase (ATP-hydrolysing)
VELTAEFGITSRAGGKVTELKGCDEIDVEAGDVFVVETPGGGGNGN